MRGENIKATCWRWKSFQVCRWFNLKDLRRCVGKIEMRWERKLENKTTLFKLESSNSSWNDGRHVQCSLSYFEMIDTVEKWRRKTEIFSWIFFTESNFHKLAFFHPSEFLKTLRYRGSKEVRWRLERKKESK